MNTMRSRVTVWTMGLVLAAGAARANNLSITNMTVTGRDDSTAYVQFDISWENSWRYTNVNHDAAWVFFKVLPDGQSDWQHVTLEGTGTNPTDYDVGTGTAIEMIVPTDRMGLFVRRSGEGAGTTALQNVNVVWNFTSNSLVKTDKVKLQGFGVEMVFVAEGEFAAGSGGTGSSEFTLTTIATNDATVTPSGSGSLGGAAGGYPTGQTAPANASFPNGYNAFYCMKYEITEGQWVDFFNTLTDLQKIPRDITSSSGKNSDGVVFRNTVAWTSGDATSARRDRACNYLNWADAAALADWAGLRPMTELEFEKACRGSETPVPDEFAWGSTTVMADASRVISGTEDGTETVTSDLSSGGCNYGNKAHTGSGDGGIGPLRAGIFATNGATRVSAGASYWGIMELSGNVVERPVTVGNTTGLGFTGLHGNGVLTSDGDANVSLWPVSSTGLGAGMRGGYLNRTSPYSRVSDRSAAPFTYASRNLYTSGRSVRSAPSGVGP